MDTADPNQQPTTTNADQNTQEVQQPETPEPPTKKGGLGIMKKIKTIIIIIVSLLGSVLLFLGGYWLSQRPSTTTPPETVTPTPTITEDISPTPTPMAAEVPDRGNRFVAYVQDASAPNVWIVDNTGSNRRNITNNTDRNTTYPNVAWVSFDTIGYVYCPESGSGCGIDTYSVYHETQTTLVDPDDLPQNSRIVAIGFDTTHNQFAYIYTVADGRSFIQLHRDGKKNTLKELPASLGRGGTFEDEASIAFSPDGRHVLVVDTLTQPNTSKDYKTLWVFETATGAERISDGTSANFATMANWISNDYVLYKRGSNLMQKNIATQGETNSSEFVDRYNPHIFDDMNKVVYWIYPVNRRTQIGTLDLDTRRSFAHTMDVYMPQWVTRDTVVGLETRESGGATTFTSTGRLLLVNINSNSLFELESSDVSRFAVEPLKY